MLRPGEQQLLKTPPATRGSVLSPSGQWRVMFDTRYHSGDSAELRVHGLLFQDPETPQDPAGSSLMERTSFLQKSGQVAEVVILPSNMFSL